MPKLESDLLRTFLAIVDAGSVTAGAARIHRSQSATSLQLKQLEDVVGQALVSRHGRGVEPTPAGARLIPVARRVTGALDTALASFHEAEIEGRLRLGLAEGVAHDIQSNVLAAFCRRHSQVELEVHCALGDGFDKALRNGDLDLAVYESAELTGTQELLRTERLVWMTARNHDAAQRDPLPVAMFDHSCWWREAAMADLVRSERNWRTVFTSESVAGVRAAVEAGMAVSLISERHRPAGLSVLSDIAPPRPSYLVLEKARSVSGPALDALTEAIRAAVNDTPGAPAP